MPGARHPARRRRPQDEQVAAQLPRRQPGLRPRRRRRDALVPDELSGAARRQPGRHRAGHPRHRAPGPAAAVEHLVLPVAVRGRGRRRGEHVDVVGARPGPLPAGHGPPDRRGRHPGAGAQRAGRRCGCVPRRAGRGDQLVRPALARPVLGRRDSRGAGGRRHAPHRPGGADPPRCTAAAAGERGDLARAHRGSLGPPAAVAER